MGRAVRRGGDFSTSVLWHLLSSEKEDGRDAACWAALISLYVALCRRRLLYGLAVDTKEITTVARNPPIAFGWCTS